MQNFYKLCFIVLIKKFHVLNEYISNCLDKPLQQKKISISNKKCKDVKTPLHPLTHEIHISFIYKWIYFSWTKFCNCTTFKELGKIYSASMSSKEDLKHTKIKDKDDLILSYNNWLLFWCTSNFINKQVSITRIHQISYTNSSSVLP
jgi:hypothetical protein